MNLAHRNLAAVWIVGLLLFASCGDKAQVVQKRESGAYVQEYNPAYLEVLWVIDDRSSLFSRRADLKAQAEAFFRRMDAAASAGDYRMAFITADMRNAKGRLKPLNNPVVLTKNTGTLDQRIALFGNVLNQIPINLATDGESKGLEAATIALKQYFKPVADIPLVIVFISDSDDHSAKPDGVSDAVDYYSGIFRSMKSRADLLRVYSINYVKLNAESERDSKRCATEYNADIDVRPDFEDRYNKVALKMSGSTANLCSGNWANEVNLTGLTLREPSRRFKLDRTAKADTILVDVIKGETKVEGMTWTFDEATNEIIFDAPPPAGSKIVVTYLTN